MQKIKSVKKFVEQWENHGYEKGETQLFWTTLLTDIFGVEDIADFIKFEQQINGKFIDAQIFSTNVLIEQKSINKNLEKAFHQAKNYDNELPFNKKSRWIITCDFQQFQIYDMNQVKPLPKIIYLSELPRRYDELRFLIERTPSREEISESAGKIIKKIYDTLKKSYKVLTPEILTSLNKLCVRIVFCRYADDCGIFKKDQFIETLNKYGNELARQGMMEIFKVLNTPIEARNPNLDELLAEFPYVNGGLFEEEIEIPKITSDCLYYIRSNPNNPKNFRWANISPPIFGAIFESVLSYEEEKTGKKNTRTAEGIHYTELKNIHKLIDPLFLDELHEEFRNCKGDKSKLKLLQEKISTLKFLDPACGSGNFLTETYLSLRRLENAILKEMGGGEIKVTIGQFYGIEINNFAASVAKTALWIAESQMMIETEEIIERELKFLPIKTSAHIETANALKEEWPRVDYIIGNPPFIGASMMTKEQKSDAVAIFGKIKLSNSIDYVGAWYHKAAQHIQGTKTKVAFVSTNSITQGEQVAPLWKKLLTEYGIEINFAYKTFKWYSEAVEKAQVHCVIIGFSSMKVDKKYIFDETKSTVVENINPYLIDAPDIFIESRSNPICEVPKMTKGNQPTDDGNFIFSEEEYQNFIKKFSNLRDLLHRYIGGRDFLNNKPIRYCLWLYNISPDEYHNNREIMRRIDNVRQFRSKSTAEPTRKSAETPYKFFSTPQTDEPCIVIPRVSSERRKYIPIGFIEPEIIVSDSLSIIPGANLYHFGVLSSIVHMAWTRVVCGRLEMRYRYSGSVVYNNFVWSRPTAEQRKKIEQTAQKILDVRAKYPNSSLAALYDENSMPQDLRKAHKENDRAVMQAYNFDYSMTEAEIVAELMKMYEKLVDKIS